MNSKRHSKTTTRHHNSARVPIMLSVEERADLAQLAQHEQRSNASMARIIYLAGIRQFKEKTNTTMQGR